MKEFDVAHGIDPALDANDQITKISAVVIKFNNLVANKVSFCHLKKLGQDQT
jgi:hypothetical protein